jgi:hypothetical protein
MAEPSNPMVWNVQKVDGNVTTRRLPTHRNYAEINVLKWTEVRA